MKYQKQLAAIESSQYSRAELHKLLTNAEAKFKAGDDDAKIIIDAINFATPSDKEILFMGFCPSSTTDNRKDAIWLENAICEFDWEGSEAQMNAFQEIRIGDLVVLKKRQVIGKTMEVSAHGRVKSVAKNDKGRNKLIMNWSAQRQVLEVPLMGCNATVNIRAMDTVEDQMPEEFFDWLGV